MIDSFRKIRERGVAMVEFAIAVPLFIVFLAIVYEGGALFYTYFRLSSAAYEGSRFCSSMSMPLPQCFDYRMGAVDNVNTTNLAVWTEDIVSCQPLTTIAGTNDKKKAVFEAHKLIQDRVASIFFIAPNSWNIKSDDDVPYCPGVKVSSVPGYEHFPTIKSQYIGIVDPGTLGDDSRAACNPAPTGEEENSCSICLSAVYQGIFTNIPLEACSTAFQLTNNEQVAVPYNVPSVGNTAFNYSYNYNYNGC